MTSRSWLWFVAGRYLRTRRTEKKNIIVVFAIIGLAIGITTLIAVDAVMNGLQGGTIRLTLEFESYHLRVRGATAEELWNRPELRRDLSTKLPTVRDLVPFGETQAMVRGSYGSPVTAMVRALPEDEPAKLFQRLPDVHLLFGSPQGFRGNVVYLGDRLAGALSVSRGDSIRLTIVDDLETGLRDIEVIVGGIVHFGNYSFDAGWILAPAGSDLGQVLMQKPQIGLRLNESEADEVTANDLRRLLVAGGLAAPAADFETWRSYNRSIFGALRVEKLMILLIISLIVIVVDVIILHYMRVSVLEKQEDIGVLRALGASPGSIRLIFTLEGFIIGLIGALSGLGLGVLIVKNMGTISEVIAWVIGAGGGYTMWSQLPSALSWTDSIIIAFGGLISAVLAALAAARNVTRLKPANVLRHE